MRSLPKDSLTKDAETDAALGQPKLSATAQFAIAAYRVTDRHIGASRGSAHRGQRRIGT